MIYRKIIWFLSLIFAFIVNAKAQQSVMEFRSVSVSNGLYNNQIWSIDTLTDRSLLIGYIDIFALYHGGESHILPCNNKEALRVSGYETRSYRDAYGNLWIKHYFRATLFDTRKRTFVPPSTILEKSGMLDKIQNFFIDHSGMIWLVDKDQKLYTFDEKSPARFFCSLTSAECSRGLAVSGVECIKSKTLIFLSDGSIKVMKGGKKVSATNMFAVEHNRFVTPIVTHISDHQLMVAWGTVHGGVAVYDCLDDSWKWVSRIPLNFVKVLHASGNRWLVVSYAQIDEYNYDTKSPDQLHYVGSKYDFSKRPISDAAIDWQGGLWVSTWLYGAYYTHPHRDISNSYGIATTDIDEQLMAMLADDDGIIYYATPTRVFKFDPSTKQHHLLIRCDDKYFTSINYDSKHRLWLTTNTGVVMFDGRELHDVLSGRSTFAVPVGDRIYLCKDMRHFGFIDVNTLKFKEINYLGNVVHYNTGFNHGAYDAHRNRILLSSGEDIISYDIKANKFSLYPFKEEQRNQIRTSANSLLCDSGGNVWISTQNGLYIIDNDGSINKIDVVDGLPNSTIRGVVEGEYGIYWVITANGLAEVSRSASGKLFVNSCPVSLPVGEEFQYGCICMVDDAVWCGGSLHLAVYQPASAVNYDYRPRMVSLTVMGEQVSGCYNEGDEIDLQFDQNWITMSFSIFDYLHPNRSVYRYMVEGMNDDWIYKNTGGQDLRLEYMNFTPGRYRLIIETQDEDGEWSSPAEWTFVIHSPWWRTWWAYLMYILCIAGLCIVCFWIYHRQSDMNARLKEKRNKFLIQAFKVEPDEIEITSQDDQFIQQAVKLVEQHISDVDYNVEQLSSDLALSRSQCYRKLMTISGQTPVVFIRTIRLRRASQLLKESGMSVSQIADKCGFSSSGSFTKYFKEMYGLSPKEYKKHG